MRSEKGWWDRHPVLGFVLAFGAFLPLEFVGQCLLRGWTHWGDALASTVLSGALIAGLQYFFILRPHLRAREEGK